LIYLPKIEVYLELLVLFEVLQLFGLHAFSIRVVLFRHVWHHIQLLFNDFKIRKMMNENTKETKQTSFWYN